MLLIQQICENVQCKARCAVIRTDHVRTDHYLSTLPSLQLTMQSIGTELGAGKSMDGGSHLGVDGAQTTRMNFGYYKGNIVAIKWLNLDNVHLHRGDLVELKWVSYTVENEQLLSKCRLMLLLINLKAGCVRQTTYICTYALPR